MNELITSVNDAVWGYVLIIALVGCGLWFTWRTHFVQFRMIGEMLRVLTDSAVDTVEEHVREMGPKQRRISSFQAFAVSVATRVGTGNLAGVASAIAIGGPGAVFWMWMIALVGSATAFVESTLAQLFKQKHKDSYIGGPAYYIQQGLHKRWMAVTFAILIYCCPLNFAWFRARVRMRKIWADSHTRFSPFGYLCSFQTLRITKSWAKVHIFSDSRY